MSANGGDIVVQLRMDDGQFRVAVVQSGDLVRALKGRIDQTAASVKVLEQHTQSLGRRFRDLVLILGNLRFIAMDMHDIFLLLPMSILATAGELERLQQLMTGLSQEATAAKREIEGLRDMNFVIDMTRNAPFNMQALSDSFVKFKTAGIDPANGSMQALVDSVARFGGSSEMLKRASVAIQQMSGKGVISMEELRQQLGEAVPSAMRAMADGLEMTMADLVKVVSTGTLEAGPALQAMFARMAIVNAGAAAEMMQTWVGMNARLKTEWELTAKTIADAGFMDASKDVIRDLIEMLQSGEFRDFAVAFGQGLGLVVSTLSDVVGFLVRYREEILLLMGALAAYLAMTKVVQPLSKAIGEGYQARTLAMQTLSAKIRNLGMEERRAAIEAASNSAQESAARTAMLASTLDGHQRELVSVRAKNAAILAESSKLSAQLAALQRAERLNNANNIGEQQRKLHHIEQLALASRGLAARDLELRQSIGQTTTAWQVSSAATAAQTAQVTALTGSMNRHRIATVAATAATRTFSAVSEFVGGPIGIAIIAITALVVAYNRLASAARDAAKAQDRQLAGESTQRDLQASQRGLENERERMANIDRVLAAGRMNQRPLTQEQIANLQKQRIDAANKAAEHERNIAERQAFVTAQNAERQSDILSRGTAQFIADQKAQTSERVNAVTQQKNKELEGLAVNSERWVAITRKYNAQEQLVYVEGHRALAAALEQRAQQAREQAFRAAAGSAERRALLDQADHQAKEAKRILKELELQNRVEARFTMPTGRTGGSARAPAAERDSPLAGFIENLRISNESLKAENNNLDNNLTGEQSIAAKLAAFRQRVVNGDFSVQGAMPSAAELAQAEALITANEQLRAGMKERERIAKDAEKVANFINTLRPQMEEAMDLFADPLGNAATGTLENRVKRFIAANLTEIESYAKQMGTTVAAVKKELTNDAQRADAQNAFAKLVQDTERMNSGLVSDSRDAARARTEADNERHRQMMQNIINERTATGASTQEIASLQAILYDNMAARASKAAEDFKSPMEKMADNWRNAVKNMEEATVGWANKSLDAMTEMVMTGKADFRSLANSIIADIIRINLQKAAASAVSSAMGWLGGISLFADGGIMTQTGSVPLKKYAMGGIANSPQLAMFGEGSTPEAYVPLPDGRSIPVTMKGGGGQNVEINITVHQSGGESSSARGDIAGAYKQMGDRLKAVVREELAAQRRPGGMLYT